MFKFSSSDAATSATSFDLCYGKGLGDHAASFSSGDHEIGKVRVDQTASFSSVTHNPIMMPTDIRDTEAMRESHENFLSSAALWEDLDQDETPSTTSGGLRSLWRHSEQPRRGFGILSSGRVQEEAPLPTQHEGMSDLGGHVVRQDLDDVFDFTLTAPKDVGSERMPMANPDSPQRISFPGEVAYAHTQPSSAFKSADALFSLSGACARPGPVFEQVDGEGNGEASDHLRGFGDRLAMPSRQQPQERLPQQFPAQQLSAQLSCFDKPLPLLQPSQDPLRQRLHHSQLLEQQAPQMSRPLHQRSPQQVVPQHIPPTDAMQQFGSHSYQGQLGEPLEQQHPSQMHPKHVQVPHHQYDKPLLSQLDQAPPMHPSRAPQRLQRFPQQAGDPGEHGQPTMPPSLDDDPFGLSRSLPRPGRSMLQELDHSMQLMQGEPQNVGLKAAMGSSFGPPGFEQSVDQGYDPDPLREDRTSGFFRYSQHEPREEFGTFDAFEMNDEEFDAPPGFESAAPGIELAPGNHGFPSSQAAPLGRRQPLQPPGVHAPPADRAMLPAHSAGVRISLDAALAMSDAPQQLPQDLRQQVPSKHPQQPQRQQPSPHLAKQSPHPAQQRSSGYPSQSSDPQNPHEQRSQQQQHWHDQRAPPQQRGAPHQQPFDHRFQDQYEQPPYEPQYVQPYGEQFDRYGQPYEENFDQQYEESYHPYEQYGELDQYQQYDRLDHQQLMQDRYRRQQDAGSSQQFTQQSLQQYRQHQFQMQAHQLQQREHSQQQRLQHQHQHQQQQRRPPPRQQNSANGAEAATSSRQDGGPKPSESSQSSMARKGSNQTQAVPRNVALTMAEGTVTTLMVRNVPVKYTQDMLLKEWPNDNLYNFLYLPICIERKRNSSFCFINFVDAASATAFYSKWHKQRLERYAARKPLDISPADVQGREENLLQILRNKIFRIRNSHFQPAIFENSVRVPMEDFLASMTAERL